MADTQKIKLPNGYMGKILKVDLTSLQFQTEPLDFHLAELFFGGRGLGAALLFRHFLGLQQQGKYKNAFAEIDPLSDAGKAEKPTYLLITNNEVKFCDAGDICELDAVEKRGCCVAAGYGVISTGGTTLEQAAHNVSSAERVGQFRTEAFINEKLLKGPKVSLFEPR